MKEVSKETSLVGCCCCWGGMIGVLGVGRLDGVGGWLI